MFVDSSALVAIIASEEGGAELAASLGDAHKPVTSPIVIFETVLALVRIRQASIDLMTVRVLEFIEEAGVELIDIRANAYMGALQAHARYGKGSKHPARLNMGDCFSYALARQAGGQLLYKGNDFAHTDLA